MFGHERNDTGDGYGTGGVKASETTSINLTPVRDEPNFTPKLSTEERAAVQALPFGSALLVAHLACFGLVNSLQVTAMNTITLFDLDGARASSGNGLLSMVMMLSMSLGVATAGGLLSAFDSMEGYGARALATFQATFITVGLITCASAWIFWQLAPNAGRANKTQETVAED